ncbi:hypothetical protein OS493_006801 [Desmophyllum pertusum]|uniref:Uncharacterized protein n=1 Tax=Desmophyllum pertusum TaxID=174260 RepID=A0A9X0D4P6_9CNID|nr:hypothetical protein OS493_006801 [Desmophyllum pertusum]
MLEKDMEEDEEDELDLMMEKCKLNNARHMGLRADLLKPDEDACRNLRPRSREISLEEEKAEVLAEMRKISESSDE